MNKKVLLSLVMVVILAIGAGLGTYAWFTASVTSEENVFEAGTFRLNGGTDVKLAKIFDGENLAPSVPCPGSPIHIENTGSLPMYLRARLDLSIKNGNNQSVAITDPYADAFEIKPVIKFNGTAVYAPTEWVAFSTFEGALNHWLPTDSGYTGQALEPNQYFDVEFQIRLNPLAGNEYQSAKIEGTLSIEGRQVVAGSAF